MFSKVQWMLLGIALIIIFILCFRMNVYKAENAELQRDILSLEISNFALETSLREQNEAVKRANIELTTYKEKIEKAKQRIERLDRYKQINTKATSCEEQLKEIEKTLQIFKNRNK